MKSSLNENCFFLAYNLWYHKRKKEVFMMNYQKILVENIHSTAIATVDAEGKPVNRIIDMMLEKDGKLGENKGTWDFAREDQSLQLKLPEKLE